MRFLPTLLFSLFAIGLGTLAVLQQVRGNLDFIFGTPPLKKGETVYDFDPNEVGRIHVLNDDGTRATVIKKGSAWVLEEPWEDYADSRVIRSLVDFAARLQIEDVIERDDVEDLADFGLKDKSIEVEMFSKSGSPLCHFKMGRLTAWRGFDPTFKSEDPTQRPPSFPTLVIRPSEEEKKDHLYICSDFANPALRTFPIRESFISGLRLFRDHQLFYLSPLAAGEITLTDKNSEITLTRESLAKDAPWTMTKPFELAANPASVNKLLAGLARLQATQVLDENAIALPEPLPENIDHTISLRFRLPDGELSPPMTAIFYPPENEQSPDCPVVISTGPGKKRSAILRVPRGPRSLLSTLPRTVNTLRSRTMTSLQVRQVESLSVSDFTGRSVELDLELDPHERARRWYARVGRDSGSSNSKLTYNGPANEFQVKSLFEALFQKEVSSFTDDASTDPKDYGLDQPLRRIMIDLKDGTSAHFVVGEKLQPRYYARRPDGGSPLEISEEAYEAALKGQSHREIEIVSIPSGPNEAPPTGLEFQGLDKPKVVTINDVTIHLGRVNSRHFYVNRLDENSQHTPHVVEMPAGNLNDMPLQDYSWRGVRLWNVNRFEIKGLVIKKANEPPLELSYNFYTQIWSATRSGKDVTALLNPNKAEKLLKKITDIDVQSWIGPVSDEASHRLNTPSLEISVLVEDIDDEGIEQGNIQRTLTLVNVAEGQPGGLHFGKIDTDPNHFLLDAATFQRLSVDLLED